MKKIIILLSLIAGLFQKGNSQPSNINISNGTLQEGEPYLVINPTNNQNIVTAWMGIKFSNSQFRMAIKTRASFNGGATWSTTNTQPHFSSSFNSADVSMAFDKNGFLYLSYIDFRESPDSGGVYVARSSDGGLTWDTPSKVIDAYEDGNKRPLDRPWIVVDKSNTQNSGTVYITTKPAPWVNPPNRNYYKVSSDSGHTWSTLANVDGGNYLVGGSIAQPMAVPATTINGYFCAAYPSYVSSQNIFPAYYLAKSNDAGQTLSYTTILTGTSQALDANCKNGYRLIASPIDSNKISFFMPYSSNGDADIIALHSNDGGQNWSNIVRVNDDAIGNGKIQDMLWAEYNEQGKIAVTWRDRRNSSTTGFWNVGYDFYYAISADNGQTFSVNQKLTDQFIAFDSVISQNGVDFMSCGYSADTLYTVWNDTRNGVVNIYFTKTIASSNTTLGMTVLEGEIPLCKIYPNPVQDYLNVEVDAKLIGLELCLFDEQGKKVLSKIIRDTNKINVSQLANGIYFIKISADKNSFIQKIVIQK
jgi:hypothetical protein